MQKKTEFNDIPSEIKETQVSYLQNLDAANYISCRAQWALFKPLMNVRKFLHYVVCANYDKVTELLTSNIDLIFESGFAIDPAKRTFESISGIKYALWSLDAHMWKTMINCIPKTDNGLDVLQNLLKIEESIETEEFFYSFNGQRTKAGFQFNFENIISAMQDYQNATTGNGPFDYDHIFSEWVKNMGGAQRMLPMHMVNEFCCTIPLFPSVDFTDKPYSVKPNYWFLPNLGMTYAIYTGQKEWNTPPTVIARGAPRHDATAHDLAAIRALYTRRIEDRLELKSLLTSKILEINQIKSQVMGADASDGEVTIHPCSTFN
ncbi:MAG: hypothetical protein H0U75_03690 [Legionella sp.]|nr:hypothetical protein [Legionella sp.]